MHMNSVHVQMAARFRRAVFLGATSALWPVLSAQTAPVVPRTASAARPAPTAEQLARYDLNKNGVLDSDELAALEAEQKSDAVLLNPFTVATDKDTGYVAASSLAGGRANTPLKLTPASISVMTQEFMDDLNITNLTEAISWTVNVETRTQESLDQGPFGSFEMNFRNTGGAGNYPTRNYFSFLFNSDSYNSERMEFSRGPNSLLFGSSSIGGLSGNLTKMARFNDRRREARFQVDSYGGWRTTADLSYGMDKFAVRFNGVVQRYKGFQNGTFTDVNGWHLAVSYKLTAKTVLRAEHEGNQQRQVLFNRYYSENASLWNRSTFNNDNAALNGNANLGSFGLGQVSATNSYLVYTLNNPGAGILDYRGNQYRTNGTGIRMPWEGRSDIPNFARLPSKDFRLGPADARTIKILNTNAFYIDHTISDAWFAQLAGMTHVYGPTEETTDQTGSGYMIDVNRLLPNGQPNPNVGRPYAEVTMGRQYQENTSQDLRLLTSFRFEIPKIFGFNLGLKQRVSLIGGYRRGTFEMFTRSTRWINNPAQPNPTNNINRINYRIYWDQPLPNITSQAPNGLPGLPAGAVFQEVDTGYSADDEGRSTYGQIVSNTTFFDDRLSIIAGVRQDRSQRNNLDQYSFDTAGRMLMGAFDPALKANREGLRDRTKTKATTSNVGAVYFVLPWLGVVANYSENFSGLPTGLGKIEGGGFEQPRGKGSDFGLKFSLLDNRLYATASYYDSQSTGTVIAGNQITQLNRIWTNLGYTDAEHTTLNYRDVQSLKAKGYEFELTANPTRNFRMTFNHSRPDSRVIESNTGLRAYFEAHLAEFQAGANAASGTVIGGKTVQNPTQIGTDIQSVKDFLNGLTLGSIQNGTLKSSTNVAGTYSFRQGMLKGFSVGGGAQFRDKRKNGSVDPQILYNTTTPTVQQTHDASFAYLYVPSTTIVTAHMSYDFRFSQKVRARFQLNVANLLNDDSPQWSSYSTLTANQLLNGNPRMQVLSNFVEFDPRKFTLTSTFTF